MKIALKKKLSLLLVLALILSMLPGLSVTAAAETTSCLAFASDAHNDTDNKTNNTDTWLKAIQTTGAASHIDYMGFCGDMGSAYDSDTIFWNDVQATMNIVDGYITSGFIGKADYTLGNHEWFVSAGGNYGYYLNNSDYPEAAATCSKFLRIGESAKTDSYITYCFGSWGDVATDTSKYGFGDDDIAALSTYLATAPTDIPIFIMSHYPLHSFGSRVSINADKVISLLNNYPNVVFLWGHNHSVFDTNYDMVNEAGDYLNVSGADTKINFTYTSAGCMSDSEYGTGSHFVEGKGLIVKIDGSQVNFTHYDINGKAINDSRTIDMSKIREDHSAGPFVVKFKDGHTNQMIAYETVAAGASATEPAHVKYDGYIYTGWDKAFNNITQDITATATYIEKPEPLAKQTGLDTGYVYISLYVNTDAAVGKDGSPIILYPIPWTDGQTIDDAVLALHQQQYPGYTTDSAGVVINNANGFDCYSTLWGHTPKYNALAFNNTSFVDGAKTTADGDVYYLLAYDDSWITTSFINPNITQAVTGEYITMQAMTQNMNSDYTYTPKAIAAADIYAGTNLASLTDTGVDTDTKGSFTLSFTQPGRYYIVAKVSGKGNPVAIIDIKENDGSYVYINLSVDGSVKYDKSGNYIAHYPIAFTPGATVNDILSKLHAYAYGAGSAWTSYDKDGATIVTSVWGLDYETNCGYIYKNSLPSGGSATVSSGDVIDVNGFSSSSTHTKASMFDVKYAEIAVDENITLTAVNTVPGETPAVNGATPVYINFKSTSYTTDATGKATISFAKDGTYIVTGGTMTNSACPIAVIKVGAGGPMTIYQIAVTGITSVPTNGLVGTPLTLTGTIAPTGATFKNIVWSVKSGAATISGAQLTAAASGSVVVTATIKNGVETGTDFTKDFSVGFSKVSTDTPVGTVYFYAVIDKDIQKDSGGNNIAYYPIQICAGDTIADAISKLHQQAYGDAGAWGYQTVTTYGLVLNKLLGVSCLNMSYGGGVWTPEDFAKMVHTDVTKSAADGMIIYLTNFTSLTYFRTGYFDQQYVTLPTGGSVTLTFGRSSGQGALSLCTGTAVSVDGTSVGNTDSKTAKITLTFTTPGRHIVTGASGTSWGTAVCVVDVINPVTDITGVTSSGIVGTPLPLTGSVVPADATNKTIVWSVKSGAATISGGQLTTNAAGNVVVTATIAKGLAGSSYTKDFSITFTAPTPAATTTFAGFTLSSAGNPIKLNGISDLVVNAAGHTFITDYYNGRVVEYDAAGKYVASYGTVGTGANQMTKPMGIAIDASGYLYVADSGNSRIVRFLPSAGAITNWQTYGTLGSGANQLSKPLGVAVKDGTIYVADTGNNRIATFDTAGANWHAYGTKGSGDGQFGNPYDVAVDTQGNIWVSDTMNKRVEELDAAGNFLKAYTGYDYTYGLAIDGYGNVFVTERATGLIKCVNSTAVYGGKGTVTGKFTNPVGLFIGTDNVLWVVDVTSGKVQKTQITY